MSDESERVVVAFQTGEVSEELGARTDIERLGAACRSVQNMKLGVFGYAERRAGLEFIDYAKGSASSVVVEPTPTPTPAEPTPTPTPSSLLTDLVEWWELDEASGNRAGSHAGLTLTDSNTVTSNPGLNSGETAAQFTSANSEELTRASDTTMQTGDIDCSFAIWFYADSIDASGKDIMCKSTGGAFEWFIELYASGGNRVRFRFGAGDVDNVESIATGEWHFLVCWHDATANTMNYELDNNGTVRSVSNSGGNTPNTNPFRIGGPLTGSRYFSGRLQRAGFWKRVLTSDERAVLYGSGIGIDYPF